MLGAYRAMNFVMFEKRLIEAIEATICDKQQILELLRDQAEGDILKQSTKYIKASQDVERLINDTELNQYDDLFKPTLLHFMYQREVKQDMVVAKQVRTRLNKMMHLLDFGRFYRPTRQADGNNCFEVVMSVSGTKESF